MHLLVVIHLRLSRMRTSIKKTNPVEKLEEFTKDEQIKTLEAKVKHLTKELEKYTDSPCVNKKVANPEMDIIECELQRLHREVVQNHLSMDKDELKKFDTLVKCLVALKGGEAPKKSKAKKVESAESLLKRVMSA